MARCFHYVSTNTDVLGWVYEKACGKPYAQILSEYIWAPMGAEDDAYITLDTHGAARAAGGICATVRDLARFGEMIRNRGLANGTPGGAGRVDRRHPSERATRRPLRMATSPSIFPERSLSQQMVHHRSRAARSGGGRHPRPVDLHRPDHRHGDRQGRRSAEADGHRHRPSLARRVPRHRRSVCQNPSTERFAHSRPHCLETVMFNDFSRRSLAQGQRPPALPPA